MEALKWVISLSATFKNLNNIRRKHILRYVYIKFYILLTLPWTTFSELNLQSWHSLYLVSICMSHEGVDGVKTLSMARLWANAFSPTCQIEMKISNLHDFVCILHLLAWSVICFKQIIIISFFRKIYYNWTIAAMWLCYKLCLLKIENSYTLYTKNRFSWPKTSFCNFTKA